MTIKPVYFYIMALAGYFGLFALLMLWNTSPGALLPISCCVNVINHRYAVVIELARLIEPQP